MHSQLKLNALKVIENNEVENKNKVNRAREQKKALHSIIAIDTLSSQVYSDKK